MRLTREHVQFNKAMDAILRADPAKVKAEVDAEIQANMEVRKARGKAKRGRKGETLKLIRICLIFGIEYQKQFLVLIAPCLIFLNAPLPMLSEKALGRENRAQKRPPLAQAGVPML